jgi:putative transposase
MMDAIHSDHLILRAHSAKEKERLIEYIKRQEEHHYNRSFLEEFKALLNEAAIEYDERFL